METQSRTVRPDAAAIRRQRLALGWSIEKLATKAICSVRTLDNIEKGASVYMSTLVKIATALDIKYWKLLPGGEPPAEPAKPEPRVQVQVVLSIPFSQFDESKQLGGFIDFVKQFMNAGANINVVGVAPGSTIITLEMSIQDMLALSSAYKEGKLAEMHCVGFSPVLNTDLIPPGIKTVDPNLVDKLKDITQPESESKPRHFEKHTPDTEP